MNSTDVLINDLFKQTERKRAERDQGRQIAPQTKEMTVNKQLSLQRQKHPTAAKTPQNNQSGAVVVKPKGAIKKRPTASDVITIDQRWDQPSRKIDATFDHTLPDVHTGYKVVAIYKGRYFSTYEHNRYEYRIGQPIFETALPDHGGGIYVHGGQIDQLDHAFWAGQVVSLDGLNPQKFDYGVLQMSCKGPFVAYDQHGRSVSSQVKNIEALRVKKIAASGVLPIKLVKVYNKQRLLQAANEYAGPSPQPYAAPRQPQPVARRQPLTQDQLFDFSQPAQFWTQDQYDFYTQKRQEAARASVGSGRNTDPWWQRVAKPDHWSLWGYGD